MKKKTLNQLKASKRNFALWCLAGMITKLYYIKHFASVYRKPLKYSMQNYYAKALISSNEGKNFNVIVAWYISSNYYVNNFLEKVKNAFDEATIKNSVYLIKFEFGNNLKIFKYKA